MATTILRTVPCEACGHRIGPDADTCPYCGERPRTKRFRRARPSVARAVGRCPMCGGRMRRARGRFGRLLARLGIRFGRAGHHDVACSRCGHRVTP